MLEESSHNLLYFKWRPSWLKASLHSHKRLKLSIKTVPCSGQIVESQMWRLRSLENCPILWPRVDTDQEKTNGLMKEMKAHTLDCFEILKSFMKFSFNLSDCCLGISFVPMFTTMFTKGCASKQKMHYQLTFFRCFMAAVPICVRIC